MPNSTTIPNYIVVAHNISEKVRGFFGIDESAEIPFILPYQDYLSMERPLPPHETDALISAYSSYRGREKRKIVSQLRQCSIRNPKRDMRVWSQKVLEAL